MSRSKQSPSESLKVVTTNRRARHEYDVFDVYEAGLVLVGTEVKALREGKCDLTGAYAVIDDGEAYLKGAEIAEYSFGNLLNHEPKRSRKLLLHRDEIDKITTRIRERGFTLIPLRVYFREGRAKVEVAVVRGKKLHDRREATAKREAQREIARAVGRRR